MQATVKHVFKDLIFLFSPEFFNTQSIWTVKANSCMLITPGI